MQVKHEISFGASRFDNLGDQFQTVTNWQVNYFQYVNGTTKIYESSQPAKNELHYQIGTPKKKVNYIWHASLDQSEKWATTRKLW